MFIIRYQQLITDNKKRFIDNYYGEQYAQLELHNTEGFNMFSLFINRTISSENFNSLMEIIAKAKEELEEIA